MRALLCMLLAAACVLADDSENRRSKLPYVADAVGNTLPPPSNGPATVGSPVNLLTPDRYEFYTFDESGELVKRLMTLEEIQAIVAAGEETEGLVTFANENQPTIAFNFSQPPYTKVHSVVTNVQNVLKAQMEAHKNRPLTQPTLDTPDVSDSWSLILPSIFGNTGVDIVPDKLSGTFTTPETETIDLEHSVDNNSLSKEGNNQIISTSTTKSNEELKEVTATEKIAVISSTTEKQKVRSTVSTTTTTTTTTSTTTPKPTPTRPLSTSTTVKPTTTKAKPITTTSKPTTTSSKPSTIKLRTTTTTTRRPQTSISSEARSTTTLKPTTKIVKTTSKPTTGKPNSITKNPTTPQNETEPNFTKVQTFTNTLSDTDKNTIQYEKISTFVPLSSAAYVTERTTEKTTRASSTTKRYLPSSTKAPQTTAKFQPVITTYKPTNKISTSTNKPSTPKEEVEKFNATTITTQSVSPSTAISSTEFVSNKHHHQTQKIQKPNDEKPNDVKEIESEINFFDVAQSFSQIASDLGGNYQPLPTTSNLLDSTQLNDMNIESKENVEIDIPTEGEKSTEVKESLITEKPEEIKNELLKEEPKPIKNLSQNVTEISIKSNEHVEEQKPSKTENPSKIETFVDNKQKQSTVETMVENKPHEILKNTGNFVKISTLEPHKNESKILTKDTNLKNASNTNDPITTSKLDLTTNSFLQSTTIDPILSESMDDLFSQVVNQAPLPVIDVNTNSSTKNSALTTESPNVSVKENKPETSDLFKQNTSTIIEDKVANTKVMTNSIPQVISNMNDIEKQINTSEKNKIHEKNNLGNKQSLKEGTNKQNIKEKLEITTHKQEKLESSFEVTTLKPTTSQNYVKNNINNKTNNQQVDKENNDKSNGDKKNQFTMNSTTTLGPIKEETKKPLITIPKPEISSSSNNKITSTEQTKITSIKENGDIAEGSQLPKVDEFKKKIQKVNIDDKELINERNNSWKLISTVSPPKVNEIPKDKLKSDSQENAEKVIVLDFSKENQGLEVTTKDLGEDIAQLTELCNELAFRYWQTMTESIEKRRSFVLSPYSITSMLAMMFMGARGATSGEMNEILKLDDMVTFNPHFTLKNISDSIETTPSSGVVVSAFIRELFSDRSKGKILTFYKERAQHFYNGHVEEVNFKLISDIIRRRTNLLVKRYTWGRIVEYMKSNTITMQPPLAAFSANIFQTDCSDSSVEGRDGEMYFVVSPNVRQRRLVPVPAVVYRKGFLAGYDPALDATAAALGNTHSVISTLFLMPGQQGNVVHAEDLEALEKRLLDTNPTTPTWNRLLRTLLPRIGLELQIPRFSHKSIFNVSTTLQKMGLKELFDQEHADLGGLNGPSKDLYLSDMVQSTTFVTCGEGVIGDQHHIEEYPESLNEQKRRRTSRWAAGWDEPRDYQRAFHDPHDVGEAMNLPLHLRPRQARLPSRNTQPARLKFDRPFLYFVRHNPTGMILYVGRYNPRLLP